MQLPILSLGFAAVGLALPALEQRDEPQTVRLTFHGGPASYSMEFPADGVVRETGKPPSFSTSCLTQIHSLSLPSLLPFSPRLPSLPLPYTSFRTTHSAPTRFPHFPCLPEWTDVS